MFARVISYMGVKSGNRNLTVKILKCMLATLGLPHAEPSLSMSCVYVIAAPLATFNGIRFWFCGLPLLPSQVPDLLIYTYPCVYLSTYLSIDPLPVYLPIDQAADIPILLRICTRKTRMQ